jgi:hypothetical protein
LSVADHGRTYTPVAVVDADLAGPVPGVAGVDADGVRVARAWVLVRYGPQPVGVMVVDVPVDGLTAQRVRAMAVDRHGPAPQESTVDAHRPGPPVTVVICTRDRPAGLARALASVRRQTQAPRRVLVVDSGAVGGATAQVARQAGAEYVAVETAGLSRARNAAVLRCPGEPIAWIDDDEVAGEHWLAEASSALRDHPGADVVCGAVAPAELQTPAQLFFETLGGMVGGRGFTEAVFGPASREAFHPLYPLPPVGAGANMVTRAGAVEAVRGFDPALGAGSPAQGGEDTLFFAQVLRSGGTVLYRPSLLTWHFHRRDVDGLRRQLRGYGTGLTAMYTAVVRQEPQAIWSLLALAPKAFRHLAGAGPRPGSELGVDVPAQVRRALRRGMFAGPAAYVRGRRGSAVAGARGGPL